jgi:hypothetical protein
MGGPNQRSRPESNRPSQRVVGITDNTEHQESISKLPDLVRDVSSLPNRLEGIPRDSVVLALQETGTVERVEQRPLLTRAFTCVQHFLKFFGLQTQSVFPRKTQSRELLATPTMQVCNTLGAPMPLPRRPCSIGRHFSLGGPAGIGVGGSSVKRRSCGCRRASSEKSGMERIDLAGSIASGPIPTVNCIIFHRSEAHWLRAGEE